MFPPGVRSHITVTALIAGISLSLQGCARLAGEWTVNASPGTSGAGLSAVTFDEDSRFTATGRDAQTARTITGRYHWDGRTLTLKTPDDETIELPCQILWNGVMQLRDPMIDVPFTIRLQRRE